MEEKKPKAGVTAYRKTDVMTANRETILLMLYAGAVRFLKQGIESYEQEKLEDAQKMVSKTQNIVNELRSTLNFEVGGEIALNLEQLYAYITRQLVEGTVQRKIEPLKEALKVLETLNSAWEVAVQNLRQEKNLEK